MCRDRPKTKNSGNGGPSYAGLISGRLRGCRWEVCTQTLALIPEHTSGGSAAAAPPPPALNCSSMGTSAGPDSAVGQWQAAEVTGSTANTVTVAFDARHRPPGKTTLLIRCAALLGVPKHYPSTTLILP